MPESRTILKPFNRHKPSSSSSSFYGSITIIIPEESVKNISTTTTTAKWHSHQEELPPGPHRKMSSSSQSQSPAPQPNLLISSREQLTLTENNTKSDMLTPTTTFPSSKQAQKPGPSPTPSGCYLTRCKQLSLILLILLLLIATSLLTFHLTSQSYQQQNNDEKLSNTNGEEPIINPPHPLSNIRLPLNIVPTHYKITLTPYLSPIYNFTLDGQVRIRFKCVKDHTDKITLHIKNISIIEESVGIYKITSGGESDGDDYMGESSIFNTGESESNLLSIISSHSYDSLRDFYHINLNEKLNKSSNYIITINYTGIISDELAGFYRSEYKHKNSNETRYIGITQFQATDARRAFPCFDEPGLKAKFQINIARDPNMTSLSNMDLIKTEEIPTHPLNYKLDIYTPSVPMSTYLVAFAVTDFPNRLSDPSLSNPQFRVWARKDAIEQAQFASDIGPKILTYFENYFNISFPLPKLDMVAISDFSAGAMENWGLITYRETAMLFDPLISSDSSKQRVAVVISHEIAHQWFGNLVTPSWWSDLWLNEGFASYVEYIGVDHVLPSWKILDQFVTDEIHEVFKLDALDSSHPISVEVGHPDEISEIFDSISYAKGASILRMMNHFLTQSTFNKGLTEYLSTWRFKNTQQNDLWESLTKMGHSDGTLDLHLSVKEIMDTWTLQKGFPVITVLRSYPTRQATFTQSKFSLSLNNSTQNNNNSSDYSWWIPLSYSSQTYNTNFTSTSPSFWLPKSIKKTTNEVLAPETSWLILNPQQTGYYRVNYDSRNWDLIITQLNQDHTKIHTVNRAQLLDDAFNLARAGLLNYHTAFNVTGFLKFDDEYVPWESMFNNIQYIQAMVQRTGVYGGFKSYISNLITPQYTRLGFTESPSDPLLTKYHRINILSSACSVGYEDCVDNAREMFQKWMRDYNGTEELASEQINPIPPNFRRLIYCNAIRYSKTSLEWDFLWSIYKSSNVGSEKAIILSALACSREPWILNRYLAWAIQPNSGIRKQDSRTVISSVAFNEIGNYIAFDFVREKWREIKKYFSSGFSMGRVIKAISSKLNTQFELDELTSFKRKYISDLGSSARAVDQAIESVQINVKWMDKNFGIVKLWLEENNKGKGL